MSPPIDDDDDERGTMNERELLAQGIRRAILRSRHSEGEVARKMNLGTSTVSKWKHGDSRPTPENLRHFCDVLGVDPEDVRNGLPDFTGSIGE